MSWWYDEAIPILRIIINDVDPTSYEFSDGRLIQTLLVAAKYVTQEISFDVDYTVVMNTASISPDPYEQSDDVFINFVVLKAACIIDKGNMRVAAMSAGLEAKCGPATMNTLRRMDGFGLLLESGACATYEQLKKEYVFGNVSWCKAVLSPFINENFIPSSYIGDDRER